MVEGRFTVSDRFKVNQLGSSIVPSVRPSRSQQ